MQTPLESLIACGTKLWLDSVDPGLVASNRALGATGATSNPVIVSELLQSGRFDEEMARLMAEGRDDGQIAWQMTDRLVRSAQAEFLAVWQQTAGNDGYVSFEVDPLLEDPERDLPHAERVRQYVELAKYWAAGHDNRLIKVPATPAGLDSLEQLVSAGISVNVTLIFTSRQYRLARSGVARCPTTYEPGPFQERVQHLRLARRHLHGETRTATLRRRTGTGRHRECQADLAGEPVLLAAEATAAAAGNRVRQHRHEASRRSALEVRRGFCRQRH